MRPHPTVLATLALAALPCAPAAADTPLDAAPGGVNLTAGVGWAAWAQPDEDTGWSIVVRTPDGRVFRPDIPAFAGPPKLSVGRGGRPARAALAVYSRPRGGQEDLYALDLAAGTEHRIAGASSPGADEVLPSLADGHLVFARRTGPRRGLFVWNGRSAPRRVTGTVPIQTAVNISRVAYATPTRVLVRKLNGRGAVSTLKAAARPRSLVLSLYRASWLEADGVVAQSDRVAVAAGTSRVRTASIAPATQSIAIEERDVTLRLGPDGLQRIAPRLAFRADPGRPAGA